MHALNNLHVSATRKKLIPARQFGGNERKSGCSLRESAFSITSYRDEDGQFARRPSVSLVYARETYRNIYFVHTSSLFLSIRFLPAIHTDGVR